MTAAPSPQASGYDDVVDLSRYPINDPADPAYRASRLKPTCAW